MDRLRTRPALIALLWAGAASLAAPAAAQAPGWNANAPENRQIIAAFNYGALEAVLASIGARTQRIGTDPAKPLLLVTFANNRRAAVSLLSCTTDGGACRALGIHSTWVKPPAASVERVAAGVQSFNQRYSYSKAYVTSAGRPGLQRYLVADYGFIRGNLAVEFMAFANQAERFASEVIRPLEMAR